MILENFSEQKGISTEEFCSTMSKKEVYVRKFFFSSNYNIECVYTAVYKDWMFTSSQREGVVAYTKVGKGLQKRVAKKLAKRYKDKMIFVTIRNVGFWNSIINFILSRPTVDRIYFVGADALAGFLKQIKQK